MVAHASTVLAPDSGVLTATGLSSGQSAQGKANIAEGFGESDWWAVAFELEGSDTKYFASYQPPTDLYVPADIKNDSGHPVTINLNTNDAKGLSDGVVDVNTGENDVKAPVISDTEVKFFSAIQSVVNTLQNLLAG